MSAALMSGCVSWERQLGPGEAREEHLDNGDFSMRHTGGYSYI